MNSATLESINLNLFYGKFHVLKDLNFKLNGRIIGILGPNGAGKSSLIKTILGLIRPSSGKIKLLGFSQDEIAKRGHRFYGYMPENDAYVEGMSPVHLIRMLAETSGLDVRSALKRTHEVLSDVGLGEERYKNIESYSSGMKQQVKLAQSLVHEPELIFLDEPTNALDPPIRKNILRLIRHIGERGKSKIIISSHLLQDIDACCDQTLILKEGKVAAQHSKTDREGAADKFIELEFDELRQELLEKMKSLGVQYTVLTKTKIKMIMNEKMTLRELFQISKDCDCVIQHFNRRKQTLEDLFLKAMQEYE